ncbi:hypothetical protein Smic_30860 [Streptomyces microflavus]|uniref:Uncharacterized protein n=1 Tax=Streptomyces microflavus TaxID=1919 RepID=A0A7J0CPV5_STRMI|nr:hypothetical protein Smic_30860 [Streptomyces microflavus]
MGSRTAAVRSPVPWSRGRQRSDSRSRARRVWLGAVKLPGTWKARVPPGARASSQRGKYAVWPGIHWSAEVETIRPYVSVGVQVAASASAKSRRGGRAWAAASASICGEVS